MREASVAGRHSDAAGNCRDLTRHTHTQNVERVLFLILGMWLLKTNFVSKDAGGSKKKQTLLAKLFKNGRFVQETPVCR